MEKTTEKNRQDIQQLRELAGSMTFRGFWEWVNKNCSNIQLAGDFAHFRHGSVVATIDAVNDCLWGYFDCYDDYGLRCHEVGTRVYFKN